MRSSTLPKKVLYQPLALAALLALGVTPARPAPVNWIGASGSFWDLAANWNPGLPSAADDALLGAFNTEIRNGTFAINSFTGTGQLRLSGGTLRAATASSIGSLALAGGTLGGAGTVSVGALNFSSGTMGESGNVFGTTTVTGASSFDGTQSQNVYYGRTLNLNGDTAWSAGNGAIYVYSAGQGTSKLNIGSGTTFTDAGAASGTGTRYFGYYGDSQLNNAGTYNRGGVGTTIVGVFSNTGTLNANAGTLRFDSGGSSNGSVNVASGATLGFQGGTFSFTGGTLANAGTWSVTGGTVNMAAGTGYSGNGNVALSSGTLRFAGAAAVAGSFAMTGGTLGGAGNVSVSTLNFASGTMGESGNVFGTTTVTGASSFDGTQSQNVYYGRTLNLNGDTAWSAGNGAIYVYSAGQGTSKLNIGSGTTFTDAGAASGTGTRYFGYYGDSQLNNAGTYTRNGLGTTVAGPFNSTGTLNVNGGTLRFDAGGSSSGSVNIASGATLGVQGGTFNFTGGTLTNAGTLSVSGGTAVNLNSGLGYSGSGSIAVSGGLLASALGTALTPGTLSITGGTARFAGSVTTGPLTMTGGTLGGAGTVTASTLSFSGGTMGESGNVFGTTTVTGATTLDGTQSQYIYYGRTLNLNGDTAWSAGNGAIYVYSAGQGTSQLNIGSGTTFSDAGAASGTGTRYIGYFGDGQINNAGTYNRNGLGTTVAGPFNNTGTVNVNSGTMRFDSGGSSSSSVTIAAGATLGFQGGTFNFSGGTLANAGTLSVSGGTAVNLISGLGYSGSGNITVSGGLLASALSTTLSPNALSVSGGIARFAGSVTTGPLTMTGGTLGGAGTVTASTLSFSGGTMGESGNVFGTTTVTGASSFDGTQSQNVYYGRTLNLNGDTAWSAGNGAIYVYSAGQGTSQLNIGSGTTFSDAGAASGTGTRYIGYFGDGQINNAGTYNRNGLGTTVAGPFNNTGTLNASAGTLRFDNGGSSSGSVNIASGATLGFQGGTFNFTGGTLANAGIVNINGGLVTVAAPVSATGAGPLNVNGGTLRLLAGGSMSPPNLTFNGGTISGPGALSANTLNWTSGGFGESAIAGGSTTIAGAATISGTNGQTLYYGYTLNLNGATTWTAGNGQSLSIYSGGQGTSKLNIGSGGVFTDAGTTGAGQTRYLGYNGDGQVNVAGSYVRTGFGTTQVNATFNNSGSTLVNGGTLSLYGGSSSGSLGVASGATLSFAGGTFALTGGSLANDGTMLVNGGTVTVAAPVTATGAGVLNVTGGTLRLLSGGTMSPANLSFSSGIVSGPGTLTATTLNWSGGTFGENAITGGSTTISGAATINGASTEYIYYGHALNLNGATTWTAGNGTSVSIYSGGQGTSKLNIGSGGVFTDAGTPAAGQTRYLGANSDGQVNVAGSYVRNGFGTTAVNASFANTGSTLVSGGTLSLTNGGSSSGSFGAGAGGVLNFGGGTFAITGGTLANDGITRVSSGLVTVAAPVANSGSGTLEAAGGTLRVLVGGTLAPASLSVSGGAVSGPGSVTAGGLNWTTGGFGENAIAGGSTTVTGPATINGANGQTLYYGYTLNLNGATTWTSGNGQALTIYSGGQGTSKLNIGAGGTFTDSGTTAAGQTRYLGNNSDGQVNVAGSYVRSGVGATQVSAIFNNTGSVQVNGGTLNLTNGGSSSGSFGAGAGGVLNFGGGTFAITGGTLANDGITRVSGGLVTVAAPVTNSGTGTLDVSAGTLRVLTAGSLTPANLSVSGGAVSGPGSVTAGGLNWTTGVFGESSIAGGSTTITGPATINGTNGQGIYYGYTLNLNGATTWSPGNGQAFTIYSGGQGTSRVNIGAGGTFTDNGTTAAGQTRYLGNNSDGQVLVAGGYVRSGFGTTQVNASFNNSGTTRVTGGTLNLNGQTVSNSGTFEASGGVLTITPASFTNYTGNTLTGGTYNVIGASTISFTGANVVTNAASILLDDTGSSFLNASNSASALANFATNAAAGRFTIQNGRNFTTAGAFTNAGVVTVGSGSSFATTGTFTDQAGSTLQLAGGSFNATTLANAGTVQGFGTLVPAVQNTGLVRASGGTLAATKGVQGSTGSVTIDAGSTLDLSASTAASSAFLLADAGSLNLGTQNLVVFKDYTNTGFGSGNSFVARAGVTGTGLIIGNNAAQSLIGQVSSAGAGVYTLDFGNVRGGTTATRSFQIANSGTGADIRGALQTGAPGMGSVSDNRLSGSGVTAATFAAIAAGANGGDLNVTLNAGATGGGLAGQSIGVVSNFGNVATQTLNITGFTSVLAQGLAAPSGPLDLGNFRVGIPPAAGGSLSASNTTAGAGAERLGIASATASGNFTASNLLGAGFVAPGATLNSAVSVATSGGALVGVNAGSVAIQFTSNGQLIDASFGTLATNLQTVALSATGYLVAQPTLPANPVSVGNYRLTTGASSAFTVINTNAAPVGYQELLNASAGGTTAGVTLTGSVTGLAPGASSNAFVIGFASGGNAGPRSGSATVNLVSDGTGSSGLGLYTLSAGTVGITGAAYNVAAGATTPTPVVVPNQRLNGVGAGAASVALNVANTAPAGVFSEALNASFQALGGNATGNGGSFTNLAAGSTNSSAMTVSVDNTAAGARSGSVTLAYQTDGSGSNGNSGLAAAPAGTQTIAVSGNVYRLAAASPALPASPITIPNQRIGDALSQAITLTNSAATDGYSERLSATIGASGTATAGGTFSLLDAGASSGALLVGVDASSAGAKSGTAIISLSSDGTGTSGFGAFALGTQTLAVSGNVFRLAAPSVPVTSFSLGNARVGSVAQTAVGISNPLLVTAGFQEGLSAALGGATSGVTAGGSFINLAAGGSDGSTLLVGLDTSTAGPKSGSATITLASNGTGTSGLASQALASQPLSISGSVYRLASPSVDTSAVLLFARVGDTAPSRSIVVTNNSPDAFTERLVAATPSTPAGFSGSGGPVTLAAGASSNALGLSLNTATAGSFGGNAVVALTSSGVGTTGAADAALTAATIPLTGRVYAHAVPSLDTTSVNFGIVRVGDTPAARGVTVSNGASGALTDTLQASLAGGATPFTAGGSVSGIGAGGSNASALTVQLSTAQAGVFSSDAVVTFTGRNPDLANEALGTGSVALLGQVNNLAQSVLQKTGGAGSFSSAGASFTLNFGSVVQGSGALTANLAVLNAASGTADALAGSYDLGAIQPGDAFLLSGFGSFSGLAAGASLQGLQISFASGTLGDFDRVVVLNPISTNGSGPDLALGAVQLHLQGTVVAVPEPGTWLLMVGGVLLLVAKTRRTPRTRRT